MALLSLSGAIGWIANERTARGQSELIEILREEILAVIAKQVMVDFENVQVRMDRGATVSTLEINVEIPNVSGAGAGLRPNPRPRHRRARARSDAKAPAAA